jgi:hypothetical protein
MDEKLEQDLKANRPVKPRPLFKAANVAPNTGYGAIKRGEIRVIRWGRTFRIPPDEARRLLGIEEAA